MSEAAFERDILERLEPHFEIHPKVEGRHFSGKHLKIDAVVVPRDRTGWKNQNVALGIEFKDVVRLKGNTTNFTRWLAQCADYGNTTWRDFGFLYVFACPSLVEQLPGKSGPDSAAWIVPRIMGHLGIGELRVLDRYGLSFLLQDNQRLWSEQEGIKDGARYLLKRKFGSR
ncbi:MAG: hypothetical protein ACI8X5_003728 [Planctomycetota bacterium]|jgi:hypothetical protein